MSERMTDERLVAMQCLQQHKRALGVGHPDIAEVLDALIAERTMVVQLQKDLALARLTWTPPEIVDEVKPRCPHDDVYYGTPDPVEEIREVPSDVAEEVRKHVKQYMDFSIHERPEFLTECLRLLDYIDKQRKDKR